MTTTRDADKFMVRMPEGMRDQLSAVARANRRSMNAELIFHMERILRDATAATGDNLPGTAPAAASRNATMPGGLADQRP